MLTRASHPAAIQTDIRTQVTRRSCPVASNEPGDLTHCSQRGDCVIVRMPIFGYHHTLPPTWGTEHCALYGVQHFPNLTHLKPFIETNPTSVIRGVKSLSMPLSGIRGGETCPLNRQVTMKIGGVLELCDVQHNGTIVMPCHLTRCSSANLFQYFQVSRSKTALLSLGCEKQR